MTKHLRHIALLLLMLLLGGMLNETWAYKVTYHILTLPFTTKNADGDGNLTDRYTNIRVEAVKVIVDETSPKVGLIAHFKSPLAQNFRYYASSKVTKSASRVQIYQYMTTTFDTYTINGAVNNGNLADGELLSEGSAIESDCDIYVTYEYNTTNGIAKLDGTQEYNIKLGDRFLCFNKDRANRPAAILASIVTEENLTSNDFTYIAKPGFNSNKNHNFHFRFKFEGSDPYNIVLRTAYNGDDTFMESDKALGKTVKKYYKGSSLFLQGKSDANNKQNNMWLASDDEIQYTQTNEAGDVTSVNKPGFYRGGNGSSAEMNPIWNSFAMLNADNGDGYVFMGTKINSNGNDWQPNNGQYLYLTGNVDSGNNPKFQWKQPAQAESTDPEIYEVRTYTYKVKTPLTNQVLTATVTMSEYLPTATLMSHIPDALKRKYVTFTGAYKEEALSTTMTSFADVETANNGREIWLKYESSMPFEALPKDGSYADARWYTLRMNGNVENQYIVKYDATNDKFNTGGGSNSDLHQGENSPEAMFAFIGDPFELKIINRYASENVIPSVANRYIGCTTAAADATIFSSKTGSSDISSWEIAYDDIAGTMILREMGSYASPKYIGWHYGGSGNPIYYKTEGSRIKVVELEKKTYYYHIVKNDAGDIAVMASAQQDVGIPLKLANIPGTVRSPFLALPGMGSITYYATLDNARLKSSAITNASYNVTESTNKDIYVRYDMGDALDGRNVYKLNDTQSFNVRLNGQYLYYDDGSIKSKTNITPAEAGTGAYQWRLEGSDPYAMIIYNHAANAYVKTTFANDQALTFDIEGNASKFVAMSSPVAGVYEVMAATGDEVNVSSTYYCIGRNTDNTVKMYSSETYPHGYNQLRFLLTLTTASEITYHLVDNAGTDLLQVKSRRSDLFFPADYRSPLVADYQYYTSLADAQNKTNEINELSTHTTIYVRYTTSDRINLQKGVLYLLKFEGGGSYALEDGADGFSPPVKAIYPYCNGDCNFFVYGQDQYDLQQEGAASTRTRWAWYLESTNNDPYHIKICSRQLETYNGADNRGYFCTYVENFKYPDELSASNHVITSLVWPGITGDQPTEYMVLGAVGQYQLVTSLPINDGTTNVHRTVNSFEQYWKTFDTIRKKILGESNAKAKIDDPSTVPATPALGPAASAGLDNRTYLLTAPPAGMGFHYYTQWAYAKRWNGYNISGKTSKGWEDIEHWYQTIDMGEGYFDFVPTTIEPAMILLDQHGWEIMRKPLPSDPDDPDKATKYNAIRPYNSPMVKEYIFWSSAKKRTGFHQYYLMDKRIGGDYTSTDLTELPPYGSENVLDAKGNLNDQYVTYIVKDEYAMSYAPQYPNNGAEFLVQQGNSFASNNNGEAIIQKNSVPTGGMQQYIVDNIDNIFSAEPPEGKLGTKALWRIKPNARIDYEMGYIDEVPATDTKSNHNWGSSNPNAYEDNSYKYNRVADFIEGSSDDAVIKKYGRFTFSNGFDPYNIQITNITDGTKYFVTNANGGELEDGAIVATSYPDDTPTLSLGEYATGKTVSWYDSKALPTTNATFMAVQDANGNMQLMPRFDHEKRVKDFSSLVSAAVDDAQTYTQLFRPMVYNYRIIDNEGHESLRYQSAGELNPYIPTHFQSPLAKDFTYYKDLTGTGGVYDLTDIDSKEISGSLAGAGLTATNATGNVVYVRYSYDEEADANNILKGKWFTMKLNEKDAVYSSGIKQASISKPDPVNASYKDWQWKLLETRTTDPDPYAVYLFNRNQSAGTKAIDTRFALLSHTSGDYALAVAGSGTNTYTFLSGAGMTTSVAATTAEEADFKSMSCSFDGTKSQVKLLDDVEHTYNYKIYTLDGIFAIDGDQSQAEASQNEFVPTLPASILSPLLDLEDYWYYDKADYTAEPIDTIGKKLSHLYGLYDDEVCVRYGTYDETRSSFRVPNSKTTEGSPAHVARANDSNDAALVLSGNVLYNIIWYNDEMMRSYKSDIDGGSADDVIRSTASQDLQAVEAYEWLLEGNDPYAIKIKSVGASDNETSKYVHDAGSNTCDLNATATTFMLIPREDYHYGVLAKTGDKTIMLSGHGDALTTSDPTKFIPFALATHKVIYHLVLATTNSIVTIPYRANRGADETTKDITGSTQRDLISGTPAGATYQLGSTMTLDGSSVTYCYDAGHISLGDKLQVPDAFYRPNVNYHFFVEGVYTNDDCSRSIDYGTDGSHIAYLDGTYRGLEIVEMGREPGLLGKTVLINIVYSFNQDLETNAGEGFVTDVSQNKWYTVETKDNSGTPWLAQYTNAWGLEVKEGRGTHYTNDYLWSPVGDPYGFTLYNRYIYKNSGALNTGEQYRVMTTDGFSEGKQLTLSNPNNYSPDSPSYIPDANSIYELLSAPTDGYFRIHPVVNRDGDQYYFKTVDDGEDGIHVKLSTSSTEFTFGLSKDLFDPYFRYVGYVGALKKTVYEENSALATAVLGDAELSQEQLRAAQTLVYNDTYIEPFTAGYYRLHSPSGLEGISPVRYASGYTHAIERDPDGDGDEDDAIPMHFYEKKGVTTTFENLGGGYTTSNATRGEITIPAVEYDPASIFYITYNDANNNNSNVIMSTQGLYVKGAVGRTEDNGYNTETIEAEGVRSKAYMTAAQGDATPLWLMDIGGGVFLIHDRSIPRYRKYLSYHQNDGANIYDLKLTHNTHTDHAKWCLQPANNLGLYIATHSGGDDGTYGTSYNYASFYAPFDILLPDKVKKADEDYERVYQAFILDDVNSPWSPPSDLHPKSIGHYNTGTYANNDRFVPAGTPVLLAMWDQTDVVKVTLPTNSPSMSLTTGINYTKTGESPVACNNLLTGTYLEQLLTPVANTERIFTFGMQLEASSISLNPETGVVTAVLAHPASAGIGFYLNANPYKELGPSRGSWTRNNRYVYGNKVYYHETVGGGGGAPQLNGVQFVPVIFGDEEPGEEELQPDGSVQIIGDGCIYDLLGRKVATKEQVEDGTWRERLAPGIYILNGKKFKK